MLKYFRTLLIPFLSLVTHFSIATDYYVKANGGTGSGLDDASAWNLSKLNAAKLSAGDRVFFKRGDVFVGTYIPNSGGNPDKQITFDAYGTGANPVISGFSVLSSWTLLKGNIYYASLEVPSLSMVTIDGAVKSMGRYPDVGYLPYTGHHGNQSLSGASIMTIPFDPAGSELVIRKSRWILDRHFVTTRTADALSYTTNNDYGNNGLYSPVDGNGYFIQNHLGTLTADGEWFYDKAAKRLYMYFGSGEPANKVVKASALNENLHLNYWTNLTFNNLDFEGANLYGLYVIGTSNITFYHCNVRYQGGDGIWGSYITNLRVTDSEVSNVLNNSVYIEQEGKNVVVDHVRIEGSGFIAGAGKSGDATQQGISISGNGTVVTNCSVVNTGYVAINFQGNDVLVEQNLVDNFCSVKDDGAGIYTYNPGTNASNRIVRKNIVLNAQGAFAGAEGHFWEPFGKAAGIYLDDRSVGTIVDQNTVANGNWGGIFVHNGGDIRITNNLVYNFAQQLLFGVESVERNRNLVVTGNRFIARTASQKAVQISLAVKDDPRLMGIFDNNIYARPVDDDQTFSISKTFSGNEENSFSLENWKSTYAQDSSSVKSRVMTTSNDNLRFEYNYSNQESSIPISAVYSDVAVTRYSNNVKIPAFSGVVLVKIPKLDLVESIASGDWNQPAIWSGGYVPGQEDGVRINKDHVIRVDQDIFTKKIDVSAGAELHFIGNHKVQKID